MMQNPEAGDIVRGSGGVRKLRWRRQSSGKRGGLRVIYFVRYEPNELWMLTLYAKTKRENVPGHLLSQLKKEFENE
jgi:hypothetical protein